MNETSEIEIKIVEAFGHFRRLCHVCGGVTEKESVVCEGTDEHGGTVRVCGDCLKSGDIDTRLAARSENLVNVSEAVRGLIGRLKTPTYEQWLAARRAREAAVKAYHASQEGGE